MRTKNLNYKGSLIYYINLSELKEISEIEKVVFNAADFIRSKPEKSVLAVTNVKNMHFSNDIRKLLTDFVSGNKSYIKASAIVGLSGLQSIIYNGVMSVTKRSIKAFDTDEEAMSWMAQN